MMHLLTRRYSVPGITFSLQICVRQSQRALDRFFLPFEVTIPAVVNVRSAADDEPLAVCSLWRSSSSLRCEHK